MSDTNKYQCTLHADRKSLSLCDYCLWALKHRHDRMLSFIKTLSTIEQENMRTNIQVQENAKKLLDEIGEI